MSSRRALLEACFHYFDRQHIPCCVQRNYAELFDDPTSDVDLLTLPGRVDDLLTGCIIAAEQVGQRLVQKTRFVNHSLVFWDGTSGFVRIDVDVSKRWHRYPLLRAEEILRERRRLNGFDVPSSRHECVIVLIQALWQGHLSDRYAARLQELKRERADSTELIAIFDAAFGIRENLLDKLSDPMLVQRLRCAVRRNTFLRPTRAARLIGHSFEDLARLYQRLKTPPGLALRSIGAAEAQLLELRHRLTVLFPLKKGFDAGEPTKPGKFRKTLFKGGLAIESWPGSDRPASIIRRRWLNPNRSFAVLREANGISHCMHVATGAMATTDNFANGLADFICRTLAKSLSDQRPSGRGAFLALVGLDGSGKTTLARNLAHRVTSDARFAGVRYFHWLPTPGQTVEFPLPEPGNQPRNRKQQRGVWAAMLSILRLLKNLIRVRLAWWRSLRPLLRRGGLVMLDRYYFNYYLDPVSVKFFASKRWLDRLCRFFPRPDYVILLRPPMEVLTRRKQELSAAEIIQQNTQLEGMRFDGAHIIEVDATQASEKIADYILDTIRTSTERHPSA